MGTKMSSGSFVRLIFVQLLQEDVVSVQICKTGFEGPSRSLKDKSERKWLLVSAERTWRGPRRSQLRDALLPRLDVYKLSNKGLERKLLGQHRFLKVMTVSLKQLKNAEICTE